MTSYSNPMVATRLARTKGKGKGKGKGTTGPGRGRRKMKGISALKSKRGGRSMRKQQQSFHL